MRIFLDTLNLNVLRGHYDTNIFSGITTTPTFAIKEKVAYNHNLIKNIREIVGDDTDIFYTIASDECDEMVKVASDIRSRTNNDDHLIFKISMSPGAIKATIELKDLGMRSALHLIHSMNQALMATKSDAEYMFPLLGRTDDIGYNGIKLLYDIHNACDLNDSKIKIIAASVRSSQHIEEAFRLGVYGVAIPISVYEKLTVHPLTTTGIIDFKRDYKNSKKYKR